MSNIYYEMHSMHDTWSDTQLLSFLPHIIYITLKVDVQHPNLKSSKHLFLL